MRLDVQCCKCGHEMEADPASRTWTRGIASVTLVCHNCGHVEAVRWREERPQADKARRD